MRSIRDYVLALAVVLAAYVVYSQTVVRLIEPKQLARTAGHSIQTVDPPRRPNPFAHLFRPGDWELNQPKVLMTSQGTLLFLDYRPLEKGRLEIRPCTLIVYSNAEDDRESQSARPVVMQAQEGAVLQFDEEVDLARGVFGRLIGGRILGDIRVFSPESQPGAADALELTTRNLQIDRLKAFTPHDVQFRYGLSYGAGSDLVLMLSPSDRISASGGRVAPVGGIESLQLNHVREVHIEPGQRPVIPGATPSQNEQEVPVRITCDGPFRFDVTRRVATFEDRVLLERLLSDGRKDRLRCEQLSVFLRLEDQPDVKEKRRPEAGDVERIVAVGKPVILEVPSQSAHTEADRIEYNLKTGRLHLKAAKAGAKVLLRRSNDEFQAPELVCEITQDKRLGTLWAPGPGKLRSSSRGDASKTFAAQWTKELRIRPQAGLQLISLINEARIDVEDQGTFRADEIHFWVLEVPRASGETGQQNASAATGMVPDRILATGKVRADSPQLLADVDRLEAWFTQVPSETASAEVIRADQPNPNELQLTPAIGRVQPERREPIVRIEEPPAELSGPNSRTEEPTQPKQHFHVTGKIVRLHFQQRGKVSSLNGVVIEGDPVRVRETNAATGDNPISMSGTRFELEGGTGENGMVTLTGQPATVSARGAVLQSSAMKLSRRDNRVTIDQPGEMVLPLEANGSDGPLVEGQDVKIVWQGSLVFDGLVAKFRRDVVVTGDTFQATAEEMQAVLSARVDLSKSASAAVPTKDPAAKGTRPEIKRLAMTGGAQFESRSFRPGDGRQQAVEQMRARSLEIDRITGAIEGLGPGWLRRLQVGGLQLPGAAAAPASTTQPDKDLSYLRVDFREGLSGNLHERRVELRGEIQAVHGLVENWDDVLDPRNRDTLGDRGMVLTSDRLEVAEFRVPGAKKGSLEMTTLGNTRIEGRDFTAHAHRLTYAAAKSQLVLEGDGRNDAEIRHRLHNSMKAQKVSYWQDTGAIEIDGVKSINLGPTSARPAPNSPRDLRQPR